MDDNHFIVVHTPTESEKSAPIETNQIRFHILTLKTKEQIHHPISRQICYSPK